MVKNPPAVQETWIQPLVWEDSLEKGMATHTVFWPGEFHEQRSLSGYSPWGHICDFFSLSDLLHSVGQTLDPHMHPSAHCSIIYNSQDMEAT